MNVPKNRRSPGMSRRIFPTISLAAVVAGGVSVLLLVAGASLATAGSPPAKIRVNAAKAMGKVNPWVFGNNMLGYQKGAWDYVRPEFYERGSGIWDPVKGSSVPAFVELAKEAGLSVSRWPGGCATHRFNWKKTVGALAERDGQVFGLPEFLRNCRDIGAEPLITVAEYFGNAQDAADLVEYLNAPDDGKHPWAAKRSADGCPAPWNVVWFEYGNESEHGDHQGHKLTAQEYARNFLAYQKAMKTVDPAIKFGAVIATGFPKLEEWARPVLAICGREADFVIHHSYKPNYYANDGQPDPKTLFRAALAEADQIQAYYDEMNHLIREVTGRPKVPVAVTEFNGHFVQEKPVPYRHCLGNALVNAEMLRVFLRPENHIVMANFWQFANEYWGQVKGYVHKGEALVKRPQYFPFALYHQHFGTELIESAVDCERFETDGGWGVAAASGEGSRFQWIGKPVVLSGDWKVGPCEGVNVAGNGDTLEVEFGAGAGDVNFYHARKFLPAKPRTSYRLSAWIRTENLKGSKGASFQIGDARGWVATQSCSMTPEVSGTKDWTKVEADYATLASTQEIEVIARRVSGGGPVTGQAWYRGLELQEFVPQHYAAVPFLSLNTSRSEDGEKVFLMVVNKHLELPVTAQVDLAGFCPQRARAWTLTGPTVDATNELEPNGVSIQERDLGPVRNGFAVEFPPHSMTAIEVN